MLVRVVGILESSAELGKDNIGNGHSSWSPRRNILSRVGAPCLEAAKRD